MEYGILYNLKESTSGLFVLLKIATNRNKDIPHNELISSRVP